MYQRMNHLINQFSHQLQKNILWITFILGACLFGCQEATSEQPSMQEFLGRDDGLASPRVAIYRAKVPKNWRRIDPAANESIVDTTKPLCIFQIENDISNPILITIYNFPLEENTKGIPANAQLARWRNQLSEVDPLSIQVKPCSHGGFSGIRFLATGSLNNKPTTMLAWAMNLAPNHCSSLSNSLAYTQDNLEILELRQMRADYTIKAIGNPDAMQNHHQEIEDFANSFELIREIPFCPY